eukprot:973814-Rhodomonas_salina.2
MEGAGKEEGAKGNLVRPSPIPHSTIRGLSTAYRIAPYARSVPLGPSLSGDRVWRYQALDILRLKQSKQAGWMTEVYTP